MKWFLTHALAGLGLGVALSLASAQPPAPAATGDALNAEIRTCCPLVPRAESNTLEVQGILRKGSSRWDGQGWQVTVGEQVYDLDLGGSKCLNRLAAELEGKMVRVTGRYEHRMDFPPRALIEPLIDREPFHDLKRIPLPPTHYEAVVVSDLERAPGFQPAAFVRTEVRGTLKVEQPVGYPGDRLAVVTAEGQQFVLDLGTPELLAKARKLDGRAVVIRGPIDRWHPVVPGCLIESLSTPSLPVVKVESITAQPPIRHKGIIRWHGNRYSKDSNGLVRGTTAYFEWEGWLLEADGHTYRLKGDVLPPAWEDGGIAGKEVIVTGHVVPSPSGKDVFEVKHLEAVK